MKILCVDTFPQAAIDKLRAEGFDCSYEPDLTEDDLPGAVASADVLVVRSTRVTAETIQAAPRLGLIVRAGAGTNTIDIEAAAAHAVLVCNTPGKNAIAVAELAFGLLLAVDRQIPSGTADLRRGVWNKTEYSKAGGLFGRSVGVVGVGEIGILFAERAVAFGMDVVAVDRRSRAPETRDRLVNIGTTFVGSLRELVESSDVVSLHVPATDGTHHLVDADLLASFRPGAILINTSRPDVVDADALLVAMDERGIRAGLDVFPDEPATGAADFKSRLASHPRVVGTHHIGASTDQAQEAIADEVTAVIAAYEAGEVLHPVNLAVEVSAPTTLTVRHTNRVGVLSRVLGTLRAAELNVDQMTNRLFTDRVSASATIHVDGTVTFEVAQMIEGFDEVIAVSVRRRVGDES